MKHLLFLLVVLVACYGVWHFVPKQERDEGIRLISRHGIRLGALVAVVLALLAVAYYASSARIL